MDDVELFTFPGSNAGLTAELVLAHAGVRVREHRLQPGLHAASLKLRGFPTITVPAARIDGVRVQGSRRIARAVADAHPDSGLLPIEPEQRERVLDAERDGERLQVSVRRLVYVVAQGEPRTIQPLIDANYRRVPRPLRPLVTRAIIGAAKRGHRAFPDRTDGYLERVATLLDRFDQLVDDGVLGTDRPTIADFQVGPNLALLDRMVEVSPVVRSRSCWAIAERTCPAYPLDVEAHVPAGWATALEAATG